MSANNQRVNRRRFLGSLTLAGAGLIFGGTERLAARGKKFPREEKYPLLAAQFAAIDLKNLQRAKWKHIIGHHSATRNGNAAIFDRYHREVRHMEHGLGYHFIIGNGTDSADGAIEIGPRWTEQLRGGHVKSLAWNENSIGICLVGNFEATRPTPKQMAALEQLIAYLRNDLLNGKPTLRLHREIKGEQTLCPGRNFPAKRIHKLFA
jgi:N-acetyl-anhydromuramyl-L-alanine amidase AmpD